jgi:hypothetical protein
MDQATIDLVENGDWCQCCGRIQPDGETEAGNGLGSPVSCQDCIDNGLPIVDRTPD